MNGILPINKPYGWTSFDVVAKLRGMLNIKKIGHGGTLDPMATGVLPVFVGKATKIIDIISNHDKKYLAEFKLGIVTNTQDITGEIIGQKQTFVENNEITLCLKNFSGQIKQIPPMFSAVKVNGQRLYKLAKLGKEIDRKPRFVEIYDIKLIDFNKEKQSGIIEVYCSKGTYIRTLINDIGEELKCGATLTGLKRTMALGIDINKCYQLDDIKKFNNNQSINDIFIDIDDMLSEYSIINLNKAQTDKFLNGVKLNINLYEQKYYRVYDYLNEFIGIGYRDEVTHYLRIKKILK